MTRPILVFGAGGRVGGELWKLASKSGPTIAAPLLDLDICDTALVQLYVEGHPPSAIINLAACTLPRAETPEGFPEAEAVNMLAPGKLSDIAREAGAPLVHISTDCVFDGEKAEPYTPKDECNPINTYGRSKFIGEQFAANGSDWNHPHAHIIIRTTGVYLRHKPNFLETVLGKAAKGETLEVVADTLYTPTDARELAKAILMATERVIEDPSVSGTYHFAGPDVMSYMDFARLVLEEAGAHAELKPTTAAEREAVEGFKRPRNAALNSDKFAETFGLRHRPTRECVRELLNPA